MKKCIKLKRVAKFFSYPYVSAVSCLHMLISLSVGILCGFSAQHVRTRHCCHAVDVPTAVIAVTAFSRAQAAAAAVQLLFRRQLL